MGWLNRFSNLFRPDVPCFRPGVLFEHGEAFYKRIHDSEANFGYGLDRRTSGNAFPKSIFESECRENTRFYTHQHSATTSGASPGGNRDAGRQSRELESLRFTGT